MKNVIKRLALVLAAVMLLSSLTGCGEETAKTAKATGDYTAVVAAKYGDEKIMLDEANFFLRYQQMLMEGSYWSLYTYMGYTNMWQANYNENKTLETYMKETIMQQLRQTRVLIDHAGEYNLGEGDIDKEACAAAAKEIFDGLDEVFFEYAPVTLENLTKWVEQNYLANKVYQAVKDAQSVTADEAETQMYTIKYLTFAAEEEDADADEATEAPVPAETQAQAIIDKLAGGAKIEDLEGDEADPVTFSTQSYLKADDEDAEVDELREETKAMKTGEYKKFQIEDTWYVVYCVSDLDEEATASKNDEVIDQKKDEAFAEVYKGWQEASPKFQVMDEYESLVMTDGEQMVPPAAEDEDTAEED